MSLLLYPIRWIRARHDWLVFRTARIFQRVRPYSDSAEIAWRYAYITARNE